MTLKPIAISKRGRIITKAAIDQGPSAKRQKTSGADASRIITKAAIDQEPSAKRQKTSGADASTLRAVGEAA